MRLTFKEIQELKSKYDNTVTLHVNKCSLVRQCPYCMRLYIVTKHQQKFCSDKCYIEHRRDYKARWKREKYNPKPAEKLGTGYLTGKAQKDFDKEQKAIRNELRRMKIYRKR